MTDGRTDGRLTDRWTDGWRWMDGWMGGGLRFFVLFNSISLISGQWAGDNQRLCAKKPRLRQRSNPGIPTSVRQHLTY